MNAGVTLILDQALGNQDGVLEVITVPRHESDHQVLPQRQFSQVRRRAVSQHISPGYHVAGLDQGLLVDTGVLVGTGILDQVIDIDTRLPGHYLLIIHPHHDAAGVD